MPKLSDSPPSSRARVGEALTGLAMLMLLMTVTARSFLGETPFHVSPINQSAASATPGGSQDDLANLPLDRSELSRVCFAALLLSALAIWMVGQAVAGGRPWRYRRLGLLIVGFAALCWMPVMAASEKRMAYNGLIEQVSLLAAAYLAAQLFHERKRFVLLLIVLAAVGATLAAKSHLQYFVEIPERISQFAANREHHLQAMNFAPGTPQAAAFENRLRDSAVTGFFSLANLFASLLVVLMLAALGLAVDKLQAARRDRLAWKARAGKGEMHSPTVAAVLAVVLAVGIVPALALTLSKGGIISGLLAVAVAATVYRFRQPLARQWKKAVATAAIVLVLLGGAVAAYGLKYDCLPSKTMTFRWYYWTAAGQIIAEHPTTGVGPGNFSAAYLQVRRPAAEEAVKMPHNFILQALAEYGLPAGGCFLAIIAYILVGICRPRGDGPEVCAPAGAGGYNPMILLPILLAMPLGRVLFGGSEAHVGLLVYDALLPMMVLGMMLLALGWFGGRPMQGLDLPDTAGRIALACGVGGFLLHNLIEFGLFMPGAATAFWVAAGACLARAGGDERSLNLTPPPSSEHQWRQQFLRTCLAGLVVAAVGGAVWWFVLPVYLRTTASQQMADAVAAGNLRKAIIAGTTAATVDDLDPNAPADLARLMMRDSAAIAQDWAKEALRRDPAQSSLHRLVAEAGMYANWKDALEYQSWLTLPSDEKELQKLDKQLANELAITPGDPHLLVRQAGVKMAQGAGPEAASILMQAADADPRNPTIRSLLGDTLWQIGKPDRACLAWLESARLTAGAPREYLDSMHQAVELNPNDSRLRISYAQMLLWAGDWRDASQELDLAMTISDQLPPESIEKLNPSELTQVRMLGDHAACLRRTTSQGSKQD